MCHPILLLMERSFDRELRSQCSKAALPSSQILRANIRLLHSVSAHLRSRRNRLTIFRRGRASTGIARHHLHQILRPPARFRPLSSYNLATHPGAQLMLTPTSTRRNQKASRWRLAATTGTAFINAAALPSRDQTQMQNIQTSVLKRVPGCLRAKATTSTSSFHHLRRGKRPYRNHKTSSPTMRSPSASKHMETGQKSQKYGADDFRAATWLLSLSQCDSDLATGPSGCVYDGKLKSNTKTA